MGPSRAAVYGAAAQPRIVPYLARVVKAACPETLGAFWVFIAAVRQSDQKWPYGRYAK